MTAKKAKEGGRKFSVDREALGKLADNSTT